MPYVAVEQGLCMLRKRTNFAIYKENSIKEMAELIITGRIIQKLPMQSGTSKAGNPWRKQEYVLETNDNFPKQICFNFFGDRIDQNNLEVGENVKVSIDIQSREWNGRWYTDVSGWKAEKVDVESSVAQQPSAPQNNVPTDPFAPQSFAGGDAKDDLPF